MPLGMLALWHLLRFTGSDSLIQTALNVIYEDMGSVDLVSRDFMIICSEIGGCSFITYLSVV